MKYNNVIIKPIATERTMADQARGVYAFEVDIKATKGKIADYVAKTFGVEVIGVKTSILPGKPKRVLKTRHVVKTAKRKKAFVTLKKGQSIDLTVTN